MLHAAVPAPRLQHARPGSRTVHRHPKAEPDLQHAQQRAVGVVGVVLAGGVVQRDAERAALALGQRAQRLGRAPLPLRRRGVAGEVRPRAREVELDLDVGALDQRHYAVLRSRPRVNGPEPPLLRDQRRIARITSVGSADWTLTLTVVPPPLLLPPERPERPRPAGAG